LDAAAVQKSNTYTGLRMFNVVRKECNAYYMELIYATVLVSGMANVHRLL